MKYKSVQNPLLKQYIIGTKLCLTPQSLLFQANTHVFPGGVLDESDSSSAWLDIFSAARDSFSSLCMKTPLPLYNDVPPDAGATLGEVYI